MVELTRRIAAVLGPTLVVVAISETINLNIWRDVDPTLVYLNGLVFLVGGLFIITSHNRWQLDGTFLVTLSGWLLVLSGVYRMFSPSAQQLGPEPATYVIIAIIGTLGIVLSAIAFFKG